MTFPNSVNMRFLLIYFWAIIILQTFCMWHNRTCDYIYFRVQANINVNVKTIFLFITFSRYCLFFFILLTSAISSYTKTFVTLCIIYSNSLVNQNIKTGEISLGNTRHRFSKYKAPTDVAFSFITLDCKIWNNRMVKKHNCPSRDSLTLPTIIYERNYC